MSINLIVNGVSYAYPQQNDKNWGPSATNWASAVTHGMLQKAGGSFPLTAGVDFGTSFGIKVLTLTSETANPASTGYLQLAKSDSIAYRNNANSADLLLGINGSDQLTFNGLPIGAMTSLPHGDIFVGNVSNQPAAVAMSGDTTITDTGVVTISNSAITDAKVSATAAIALSKLASAANYAWYVANGSGVLTPQTVTANFAVATDSNGLPTASSTTSTELGYVHGVTSAIQSQLNSISAVPAGTILDFGGPVAPSGYLLCNGVAVSRATYAALFSVIGEVWGAGDGSTTFNVPALNSRVTMGSGTSYQSIVMDGTDGGVNSNNTTADNLNLFSVSIWVNYTAADASFKYIIGKSVNFSAGGGNGWYVAAFNNTVRFQILDGVGNPFVDITSGANDGNWHNVLFTFNNSGNLTSYLDGILKHTTSAIGQPFSNSEPVRMAKHSTAGFYTGSLADARIWNTELSSVQVSAVASGLAVPANLIVEWAMTEGSGVVLNDSTINGNVMTFNAISAWSVSVPAPLSGTGSGIGLLLGESTHTLTTAEIPAHNHPVNITDPGHNHTTKFSGLYTAGAGLAPDTGGGTTLSVNNSNTTGITATTSNTGGGTAHNNIQPSAVVLKIIKY